ncbi:MAG: nicotinate-nucleotide adenylyltransferase [Terriglobales bacterium]|jgi:nicotinate-nucleotide adenylyltransferase
MNICLFGGTFDPIHKGHTAIARAAADEFDLKKVLFAPSDVPPHKRTRGITPYWHRYAMVAIGIEESKDKRFIPSAMELELNEEKGEHRSSYTIQTLQRLAKDLKKSDRLFFLIGIDAFMDVAKWHRAEDVLRFCDFIVASRPGFSLADVARAVPASLQPPANITKPFAKSKAQGEFMHAGVRLHLMDTVKINISATAIRKAAASKSALKKYVSPGVADYINKTGIYRG